MQTNQVSLARQIATTAHLGQFRRDEKTPYIEHPSKVVEILQSNGASDDVLAIAWLHDVLEDTSVTEQDLLDLGIESSTVNSVKLLTKPKDKFIQYEDYLNLLSADRNAVLVKIADMEANLSDSPTEKQKIKYSKGQIFLIKSLNIKSLDV